MYSSQQSTRNLTSLCPNGVVGFRDSQKDCLLEATQTDSFVGLMTPKDVGKVLVEASRSPDAAYKTFAVRRQLGEEAQEKEMQPEDYRRLFLGQVHGKNLVNYCCTCKHGVDKSSTQLK